MGEFAKTGALDPVPATFDKSQFFEGAWSTNVVGEVAYGVPWYVETRLIYYRTDIAEKAGYGQPPATWEDLKAMARAMQEKGGSKWGINLQAGGTGSWQTYLPFVWSNGGDVLGPDGKFMLNSPEAAEALAYYQSFFKEGLAPTSLPDGALVPGFVDGSIPMFISGPWFIGILKEQGGARIEGRWGLAPMPRKKTASSFVGGGNLAVFKDSKNREVAWKFAEFLTDPATQVKWYAIATDLPSVQAAWSDRTISADQRVARFGEQLKDARSAPAIPSWEGVASAIDDQVAQATRGQATAQQAADAMQQKAEEIGTGLSR
jgi:multiple sugar transport system substrate-binding protein